MSSRWDFSRAQPSAHVELISVRRVYRHELTYDNATSSHYGIGRLASMTDPSGTTTYTYERRGLLASTIQTVNETAYTTSYAYDGDGNQTTINLPSGRTLTYTFDFADRPESVSSGDTNVSSATYEPFGPRSQTSYGNGTEQTITYDERYLPTEMKVTNGSGTLSDLSYTTNAAGFVTAVTDNLNSAIEATPTAAKQATRSRGRAPARASGERRRTPIRTRRIC